MKCVNCDKEFYEEYKFCPDCGQNVTEQLGLKILFKDTIGNYLSVDSRIFKSIVPILLKPGHVPKQYVLGKRNTYLHPARFYLFASVLYFFLLSFTGVDSDFVGLQDNSELLIQPDSVELDDQKSTPSSIEADFFGGDLTLNRAKLDSIKKAGGTIDNQLKEIGLREDDGQIKKFFYKQVMRVFIDRGENIETVFMRTIPVSLFFMLPIFALLLKLFHRKKGPYSHHLVFTFYFFTFMLIFMILSEVLSLVMKVPDELVLFLIIGFFFYLVFGVANFYNQRKFKSFWKSSIVASTFTFLIIPISLVIMSIATLLLY